MHKLRNTLKIKLIMIIDSHVHISYIDKKKKFSTIKSELLYEMKRNKIFKVIVIPDNIPNSNCCGLDALVTLTKNNSKLLMVGSLKVEDINTQNIDKINKLFYKKIISGFKIFPGHDPVYPTDERWKKIYKLCVKYSYPLIIHTGINSDNKKVAKYNDPKHIIKVAKLHPELKIIISHYFWPKIDYCFKQTQGYKNIYFDTSALADDEVVKTSGGMKKIRDILKRTIERDRKSVLFGSDWPMADVSKHIRLVNSLQISQSKKDEVFYRNAEKIFKINK